MFVKNPKKNRSRRRFLGLAVGASAGGLLITDVRPVESVGMDQVEFEPFDRDTRIDIGNGGDEMIKRAYRKGYEYEDKYRGCARCTVAALQDALEFIPKSKDVFRTACCLDGGATPSNVQNCGAFTGSGIIIGYICGTDRFGNTGLSHNLIHQVYKRFKEKYGSVLCRDVREKGGSCPEVVGKAAGWAAEVIIRQFTNYE